MFTDSSKLAGLIGNMLHQSYEIHEGIWWLFTLGKPARPLTEEEVRWHTERRHHPFVENGIKDATSEEWWAEPITEKTPNP